LATFNSLAANWSNEPALSFAPAAPRLIELKKGLPDTVELASLMKSVSFSKTVLASSTENGGVYESQV
jgi:hypothetical protein